MRNHALLNRRDFLRATTFSLAGIPLAEDILLDPFRWSTRRPPATPSVRIRGRVRARGRGIPRVAVSDGLTVTETDRSGSFEILSDPTRRWVSMTLPSGHSIPTNEAGTARHYRRIQPNARGEMNVLFELQPLEKSDDEHVLLLLADPQTEDDYEMRLLHEQTVPDVRETLRSTSDVHTFGVACGDIMFDRLALYPEYEKAVTAMRVPFFQVVGNHDLDQELHTDEASITTFEKHFGPPYYSFDRGQVHYVVLDDVFWHGSGYLGYLDADQLTWLAADLARVERGSTVIVMAHIPVLGSQYRRRGQANPGASAAIMNREELYRLLEGYRAHVLIGHMHETEHGVHGGVREHVNGAVCGAWWSGPICHDGTPNGYSVYHVKGDDIRWRYKSTGHAFDYQMRLYPRGADPSAPDEIIANVWNWDPSWTVVWYEGTDRRGAMSRRTGFDPLAVQLHRGEDTPARRTWVEPVPTDHLFYAPVAPDTVVRVEAKDPFGNTYSAEVR